MGDPLVQQVLSSIMARRTNDAAGDLAGALSIADMADYVVTALTPVIVGSTTAGAGTYSAQSGKAIQLGGVVFFSLAITWSAHTGTGNMRIAGLPIAASISTPIGFHTGSSAVPSTDLFFIPSGQTYIQIDTANGAGQQAMSSTGSLLVSGHYFS